jgi:hypothetical protein
MRFTWHIEPEDIAKVQAFVNSRCHDTFVKQRIAKNLSKQKPPISEEEFWECLVACLLTTQQKSGPKSKVTEFIATRPFPLRYDVCMSHQDELLDFAHKLLAEFGGLRWPKQIAADIAANLGTLEGKWGWQRVFQMLDRLREVQTQEMERTVAHFIDERLCGFGPKQSRNLLQALGLTKYEIPIDSRVTKWLNDFGFPLKLSANALADSNYYEFVLDAVQQLCREADVVPCVLDAAIFSSFDGEGWDGVKNIW